MVIFHCYKILVMEDVSLIKNKSVFSKQADRRGAEMIDIIIKYHQEEHVKPFDSQYEI